MVTDEISCASPASMEGDSTPFEVDALFNDPDGDPSLWEWVETVERSFWRFVEFPPWLGRAAKAHAVKAPPTVRRDHMSPAEIAAYLGVDHKTIERRIPHMTPGVHYVRVGRRIVMNTDAAVAFFAGQRPRAEVEVSLLDQFTAKARRK